MKKLFIDVKKYLNVYQYLQDVYSQKKCEIKNFSFENWAVVLGVGDKSYLRMMVLGRRPINEKMTKCFIDYLKLSEEDAKYFTCLVLYTQSKTHEQKKIIGQKMISLLKNELDQHEINDRHQFLTNPIMPKLQVMLSFYDLDQNPKNLGWLLSCSEEDITSAINKLMEFGLIEKKEDRYFPIKKSFKVPDKLGDFGLEAFYLKNLADAGKAVRLPSKDGRFKSLLLPMNEDEFELYLENLSQFTKEQLKLFNADYYDQRRLYQLHFNIIPIVEKSVSNADSV